MQCLMILSLPARHACKPSGIVCRPFRHQRHLFRTTACQSSESTMSQSESTSLLSTATSNNKKKLRILCLHGYLQNAEVRPCTPRKAVLNAVLCRHQATVTFAGIQWQDGVNAQGVEEQGRVYFHGRPT